jgi:hypothetical protein
MIEPASYRASFYNNEEPRTAGRMPVAVASPARASASARSASAPTATHGFSFLDFVKGFIDIINPLQHIPVISAIYRHITGDEISPMARIAGDALYGGPIGGAVAMADIAYQKVTGQDVGETVIAALSPPKNAPTASPAAAPDTVVAFTESNLTTVLHSQEALALADTPPPPALLARQMSAAIDSYAKLNQ